MNILFLVTESTSANGICCKAIMNEFIKKGDSVFCITNKEADLKENEFLENGVRFFTVRPRTIYAINSFILANNAKKPLICKFLKLFNFVINKFKLFLIYPIWPLVSPLYVRRINKIAKSVCEKQNIDVIVPIYSQVDTLIVANKLKCKNPKIKYIPYFLDSFSGGYGPKMFSTDWIFKRGLKWERRLLPSADKIVMMESARKHYDAKCSNEDFNKKIQYLDLPLFEHREYVQEKSDEIKILYAGALPVSVRSPKFFLEAFTRIKDERLKLTFVGDDSSADLKYYSSIDNRITYFGRCSHNEVIELEKNATIFLNIGNNLTNMTPSKIFEYLSWNKPIISTMPIDNEPSAYYLEKFPLALLLNEKNLSFDEAALIIKRFIDENYDKKVPSDFLNETFKNNMPKSFLELVYSLL